MRKLTIGALALTISLFITIVLYGGISFGQTKKLSEPEQPRYTVDAKWAVKFYAAINDEYYQRKLPPITFEFVPNLKNYWGQPSMAETSRSAPYHMKMDAALEKFPPVVAETLYHESCHIYLTEIEQVDRMDDHGSNFQSCMLDKAERGAFKEIW